MARRSRRRPLAASRSGPESLGFGAAAVERSYGNAPMFRSFGMCGWVACIVLLFSVLLSAQVVTGMETAVEAAAAELHTGSSATDPGEWRTPTFI